MSWRQMAVAVLASAVVALETPAQQPAAAAPPSLTVDGRPVDWQALRQKTVLVAFFSLRMRGVADCLAVYEQIHAERRAANLEVIGVCVDADRKDELLKRMAEHRLTFSVLLDEDGRLRAAYRPSAMPQVWFFAEHDRPLGDLPGFPEDGMPTPAAFYANLLRRAVGLDVAITNDPARTPWPPMPAFAIPGTAIASTALAGKPYVFLFVAPDCDKCRAQLELFRTLQPEFAATPLQWVCVLVGDADPAQFASDRRLPFPVFVDHGGQLRRTLHYRGFVPDTLLVDDHGRIRYRHTVFDVEQPPLYRMELRALTGMANPPILKPNGPSGVRRCAVCHEREYFDWQTSGHAHALRSLQAIGRADDPECVRCHVVGWQQAGGYDADGGARATWLADVQCESCHGNGGPHLRAGATPARVSAAACAPCHDEKHSLGFTFERFVRSVDHDTNLLESTPEQRAAAARQREQQRRALLEPDGAYVGAAACRPCHQPQYDAWAVTPHAHARERLAAHGADAGCVPCHTTGNGRPWADRAPNAPARDQGGVQCESCHGPGERHLAADGVQPRRAAIIGLGARCEQCVVKRICTNCHDHDNDPSFELERALPSIRQRCRAASPGTSR